MQGRFASMSIRYDGLDADRHEIDLMSLGESLQGVARILAISAHFVATQQYAKQIPALEVRVLVAEPQARCFSIRAVIEFAKQQQLLAGTITILPVLLSWIFAKASNDRAEMKALKNSLDKAIEALAGQNAEMIPRLLSVVERMAESLRPAARAAVAPVGKSCKKMSIGSGPVIDERAASAIRSTRADEITDEREWEIELSELDLEAGTGKVRFIDEVGTNTERFRAVITDPAFEVSGNPYLRAFALQASLRVRGKASLREGEIQALFISNTAR